MIKPILFFSLSFACGAAQAQCVESLPLKGMISVENCDPTKRNCVDAGQALYQYMEKRKDDAHDELYIGIHGSPWHFYDGQYHIIEPEELAENVRQQGRAIKHVVLLSSWSGIAPTSNTKSPAQRLSAALGGIPVDGQKGFVWFDKDGSIETTQQAFTAFSSGPYRIAPGEKVMASLAVGWFYQFEAQIADSKDARAMLRAGVGFDVFMLCPEHALKTFEAAAALGDPVAAYNAAILKLERANPGDMDAATALLNQAAAKGDDKAKAKLKSLAQSKHGH